MNNRIITGLLLVISFLTASTSAMAMEVTWGGTVRGNGSATFSDHQDEPETAFSLKTALSLESLIPISDRSRIEFDAQPSYTWTDERPYLFDLDRAKFDITLGGALGDNTVLRSTLGRFRLSDTTRTIISHTVDGGELTLSVPFTRIRAAGGYTGFVLNPVSTVRMSETDTADSGDEELFFGPARVVALGEVSFPGLVLRQTVTGGYVGQWDLRNADTDEGEDSIDSHYVGIKIEGPIVSGLFYDLSGYMSPSVRTTAEGNESQLGVFYSGRLRYFRSDWNSSRFALSGVLLSGADYKEDTFYLISDRQASAIAGVPSENVVYGELSYGLRPFDGSSRRVYRDIQTTATGRAIFRVSTDLPVDSFAANVTDDGRYVGTETTLQIGWRILSDFGASITGGAFFPGTGSTGAFTDERKPEYVLRMQVSASF